MAQTGVPSWSKTAATNATIDANINFAEGQAPSSLNDSNRAVMAAEAKWREDLNGSLVTSGTSTAYTLTTNTSCFALVAGYQVAFQINATNTGTSTLAVDGLTAKPLRSAAGVEVLAGALLIGATYRATYFASNSGEWIIESFPILGDKQIATAKLADSAVTTAKIADANVTYAKIQNVTAARVLGSVAGSAPPSELTITNVLDLVGSAANGDILIRSGGAWTRLAKATDGNVLGLSSGLPAWLASPAMYKISAVTASSQASVAFTSGIDSTYRKYVFEIDNLLPVTNDVQLICEVSDDAGATWKATSYLSISSSTNSNGVGNQSLGTPTTYIPLTGTGSGGSFSQSNTAGYGWSGEVQLVAPSSTTIRKAVQILRGTYLLNGAAILATSVIGGGMWTGGTGALTGIRFRYSSGNVASGTVTMYGVVG